MKKFKRTLGVVLTVVMLTMMTACGKGGDKNTSTNTPVDSKTQETEKTLDYTFGEGETFHSNEPIKYSMMYSDHEAYPYQEGWRLWSAISEKSNVSFDLVMSARTEYENQKSLLINSGDAPYIIPKTYVEAQFIPSGQIVAISDWVQYMPNYMNCVKKWGLEDDLQAKMQADGKYYVLPGLWESAGAGYSYIIRKDVFDKAGVDVEALQASWTYEEFYEALKKVKESTGASYVWSDASFGDSALNIAATVYGVTGGWGLSNGLQFDHDKQEFYFADTTEEFKAYLTYFNKLVKDGILDPETFTQDDDTARSKFYKGDTYVMNGNYQNLADNISKMQVEGELYMVTQPGGPKGQLQIESSRLENGIMISTNALEDLGEEGFIKMLRFVDWLWYSNEGQTLCLWGVEGETYTKDAQGNIVLNTDISYNGKNLDTATKQLNVDYGFAGGVFAYGGSTDLRLSKMTDGEKDFLNRILETREPRKLAPPIMGSADESEQLNLISTPLMDYIDTMILKFITGQEDLQTGWDNYVAQCEANGSTRYTELANEIFNNTKSILGY
ncbi:sugar ABC transporter substrate-binding protein [Anaerocolumna cellulosilytica]|uniref:Sugar ABC transporter substrate-binding protein n=1 Tax=Anaerocolumna cellulosilytica TaxID=433286 RepID=A0A6S6QSP0_9FIRM|nr:extracellular solute-binding protein [Anaerocolumna cellulosilytica]MBB5194675.1 putative aldouronate transport system substrate-binding protein [Anaerocolumna cellulosilytica]BCJ94363.1 sugar ABC transporter substrate-binding protein [Anaerocolumna cellulosilytica]